MRRRSAALRDVASRAQPLPIHLRLRRSDREALRDWGARRMPCRLYVGGLLQDGLGSATVRRAYASGACVGRSVAGLGAAVPLRGGSGMEIRGWKAVRELHGVHVGEWVWDRHEVDRLHQGQLRMGRRPVQRCMVERFHQIEGAVGLLSSHLRLLGDRLDEGGPPPEALPRNMRCQLAVNCSAKSTLSQCCHMSREARPCPS
mmetsp:Transcript_30527/g.87193  ORF Transcript_30527/g.87193 Transcript_30527/m.87193 type:complete len:202 (-) Transcript_30527:35-640(-)